MEHGRASQVAAWEAPASLLSATQIDLICAPEPVVPEISQIVHNGGTVRGAQIRGLITHRDEDPSHIKEPADQAPDRSSGLGLQARPEHPGPR